MFTQSQIDQFHHDGTIVAKNLIKGEELEKLQEAADKVVNKAIENTPEDIPNNEKEKQFIWKGIDGYMLKKDGRHIYRRSSNMFDRDPVFKGIFMACLTNALVSKLIVQQSKVSNLKMHFLK